MSIIYLKRLDNDILDCLTADTIHSINSTKYVISLNVNVVYHNKHESIVYNLSKHRKFIVRTLNILYSMYKS